MSLPAAPSPQLREPRAAGGGAPGRDPPGPDPQLHPQDDGEDEGERRGREMGEAGGAWGVAARNAALGGVTGRADLRASVSPPLPLCQSLGLGGNTECARGGRGRTQRGPARVCGAAAPLVPVPALSPSRCARGARGGPGGPRWAGGGPAGSRARPPRGGGNEAFPGRGRRLCAELPPPSAPPPLGPFSSGPTPPAQFPHSRRPLGGTCGRSRGRGGIAVTLPGHRPPVRPEELRGH